ncbi:unnamed protein product [Caenorhabditis nigoni]
MNRPKVLNLSISYSPYSDLLSKLEKVDLKVLSITVNPTKLELSISTTIPISQNFENPKDFFTLEYRKMDEGCLIFLNNGEKQKVPNIDFLDLCVQDFLKFMVPKDTNCHILDRLKFSIGDFEEKYSENDLKILEKNSLEILENLERNLKNRNLQIPTENFICHIRNQSQVLKILPYLDAQTIEKIGIFSPYFMKKSPGKIDIDRLVELDQWKKSKIFETNFEISTTDYSRNFGHFLEGHLKIQEISAVILEELKNAFLPNPGFRHFVLEIGQKTFDENILFDYFGPPENPKIPIWIFKDTVSRDVLSIQFAYGTHIIFSK